MLVVAGLLYLLFQKTKLGLAMRAVASNPESAPLAGIKTGQVLMISWGLAAAVGAIGGCMVASLRGNVDSSMMLAIFFSATAAAMLGGFDSLVGAVVAGLLLGVIESMGAGYQPDIIGQGAEGLAQPRDHPGRAAVPPVRVVRLQTGGARVKPFQPVRIDQGSPAHWALRAVGFLTVAYIALSPFFRSLKANEYGQLADIAILALAALSLNLLIGFTGQISIGHSAFFGLGGYTTAILMNTHGWSAGWTFPVAAALCFVVGVLVGIPALRLTGVYLSLVTLALAQLFPALVRKFDDLTGGSRGISNLRYDPPSWTGLDARNRTDRTEWLYILAPSRCWSSATSSPATS